MAAIDTLRGSRWHGTRHVQMLWSAAAGTNVAYVDCVCGDGRRVLNHGAVDDVDDLLDVWWWHAMAYDATLDVWHPIGRYRRRCDAKRAAEASFYGLAADAVAKLRAAGGAL